MRIMQTVDVKLSDKHELAIEWVGGATNDMVADSVLAVVLGIESSPASVKRERFLQCRFRACADDCFAR